MFALLRRVARLGGLAVILWVTLLAPRAAVADSAEPDLVFASGARACSLDVEESMVRCGLGVLSDEAWRLPLMQKSVCQRWLGDLLAALACDPTRADCDAYLRSKAPTPKGSSFAAGFVVPPLSEERSDRPAPDASTVVPVSDEAAPHSRTRGPPTPPPKVD